MSFGFRIGAASVIVSFSATHAQVRDWAVPVSGDWSEPTSWSALDVPDTAAESARLGLGVPHVAVLGGGVDLTIGGLELTSSFAQLDVVGRTQFRVVGDIVNNGLIRVETPPFSGVPGLGTRVFLMGETSISGTGELVLEGEGGSTIFTDQADGEPFGVFINGAGHTIRGVGAVSGRVTNLGLILADNPGTILTLGGAPKTNAGVIRADQGTELWLGSQLDNTAGVVVADGGVVSSGPSTFGDITGGVMEARNGGAIRFDHGLSRALILRGVELRGNIEHEPRCSVDVYAPGLTNSGEYRLNHTGDSSGAILRFRESATLGGSGTLVGVPRENQSGSGQIRVDLGAVATNAASHTIRGTLLIRGDMVNAGTIISDGAVNWLEAQLMVNAGTILARPEARVLLGADMTLENTGGEIRAEGPTFPNEGGLVRLGNTAGRGPDIIDGTVRSIGNGVIEIYVGSRVGFDGVQLEGTVLHYSTGQVELGLGGLVNDAEYRIVPASPLPQPVSDAIVAIADSSIAGMGSITCSDANSQIGADAGFTLDHGPEHTIRGAYRLVGAIVNRGTIESSIVDESVELVGSHLENRGVFQVRPSSRLGLTGSTIRLTDTTPLSNLLDARGAWVTVRAGGRSEILGGKIMSELIDIEPSAILGLDDIDVIADAFVGADARIEVGLGGASIAGVWTVGQIGPGTGGTVELHAGSLLDGAGAVVLRPDSQTSRVEVIGASPAAFGEGVTLSGSGDVDGLLHLRGRLAPGDPDQPMVATLRHHGELTFGADHEFVCDLFGPEAGEYDELASAGAVHVDGDLIVRVAEGANFAPGDAIPIIRAGQVAGRFRALVTPPATAPYAWRAIYQPDAVELRLVCSADLTADGTSNGIPDGAVTLSDFSYYLGLWGASDSAADLTTDGTSNGIPDGAVTLSDFSFYLGLWGAGCP